MFILNENFLTITEYNNWLTSLWNYPPTNVARKFICSKMKTSVLGNIWWYNSLFNNLKLLIQSESSSVDIFTLTKTKYLLINLKNTCLQKQKKSMVPVFHPCRAKLRCKTCVVIKRSIWRTRIATLWAVGRQTIFPSGTRCNNINV